MTDITRVLTPLEGNYYGPCQWLRDRLGEPYTGETTTDNSYDGSGFADSLRGWQAYFDPALAKFCFDIKDKAVAVMFKLTWA